MRACVKCSHSASTTTDAPAPRTREEEARRVFPRSISRLNIEVERDSSIEIDRGGSELGLDLVERGPGWALTINPFIQSVPSNRFGRVLGPGGAWSSASRLRPCRRADFYGTTYLKLPAPLYPRTLTHRQTDGQTDSNTASTHHGGGQATAAGRHLVQGERFVCLYVCLW